MSSVPDVSLTLSPVRRGRARLRGFLLVAGLLALPATGAVAADETPSTGGADLVARGKYLATAADCAACHTAPGGKTYAGGYELQTPMGVIVTSNITPSKAAGIGAYSEADFARAVREGVAPGGRHLYPAMPYTEYSGITDADIAALYAYFTQGVEPVDTAPAPTHLKFPFSIRASMAGWNMLYLKHERFTPRPGEAPQIARGRYLADVLEHCGTCHTPRDIMMGQHTNTLAGGSVGAWYAPNITPDRQAGIGGWSADDLAAYLATGRAAGHAQAAGPMAEAVEHSLQHLAPEDIAAIVAYLRQVPAVGAEGVVARDSFGPRGGQELALRGDTGAHDRGWEIYSGTCGGCHQDNAQGNADYPSLFHNSATGGDKPDNLIATILFGFSRTVDGKVAFMPPFGPRALHANQLSDQDVADVSNYVFAHYGNPKLHVTADDVATIRQGGPVAPIARLGTLAVPGLVAAVIVILGAIIWIVRRRGARA